MAFKNYNSYYKYLLLPCLHFQSFLIAKKHFFFCCEKLLILLIQYFNVLLMKRNVVLLWTGKS